MLERLNVKDYQILKSVELKLEKFTAIVGSSGNGKSSVVRALRNLFTASAGTSAVRHGASCYKIGLEFDDGQLLAWSKGKKTNVYAVGKPGSVEKYDKVGSEVPPKAVTLTNLGVTHFGDKRVVVNIHSQHDAPFLISESGSVVSEFLGSVSGLDKLFVAVDEVAGDIRRSKIKIKDRESQSVEMRQQVERLEPVVALKNQIDAIVVRVEQIELEKEKIVEQEQMHKDLAALGEMLSVVDKVIVEGQTKFDRVQKQVVDLQSRIELNNQAFERCEEYTKVLTELAYCKKEQEHSKLEMKKLMKDLEQSLPQKGICPTCGQEVTEACRGKILVAVKEPYEVFMSG